MEALVPLLAVLGVLGLLSFAILKTVVKASSWEKLAEAFPSHGSLPDGMAYSGCAGRIGKEGDSPSRSSTKAWACTSGCQ
jgi:hypothetical protein